jgi:hypothetical protein
VPEAYALVRSLCLGAPCPEYRNLGIQSRCVLLGTETEAEALRIAITFPALYSRVEPCDGGRDRLSWKIE